MKDKNEHYPAGNWKLPKWWTAGPPTRDGKTTYAEAVAFYNSSFVRNVLGHKGGITTLPKTTEEVPKV